MRNWQVGHKVMPKITQNGTIVTIENVRDFRHSSQPIETNYISRTLDLSSLEGADLISIPFGFRNSLSHIMISFRFADSEPLCLSIEARRSEGEEYSALKGLAPHFGLIYIWGTELDLIGLRAIKRRDPVYLYPLDIPLDGVREILQELLRRTESLSVIPENYNTVLDNCTTNIWKLLKKQCSKLPFFHYSPWLSGYFDKHLISHGVIRASEKGIQKIRQSTLINTRFSGTPSSSESFSKQIRA